MNRQQKGQYRCVGTTSQTQQLLWPHAMRGSNFRSFQSLRILFLVVTFTLLSFFTWNILRDKVCNLVEKRMEGLLAITKPISTLV